jgi:hypothetical protein
MGLDQLQTSSHTRHRHTPPTPWPRADVATPPTHPPRQRLAVVDGPLEDLRLVGGAHGLLQLPLAHHTLQDYLLHPRPSQAPQALRTHRKPVLGVIHAHLMGPTTHTRTRICRKQGGWGMRVESSYAAHHPVRRVVAEVGQHAGVGACARAVDADNGVFGGQLEGRVVGGQ